MLTTLFKVSIIAVILSLGSTNSFREAREQHRGKISSTKDYRFLSSLSNSDYINKVLDNILIPRVVGTEGHEKVFKYIQRELKLLHWHVAVDEFMDKTPIFGNLKFRNIIATLNPQAERFLVLSAHYDSKYFKNQVFVGAVDSAVPVAMMLEIAKTMTKELKANNNTNLGLKFVFFDGEEAFQNWGPKDSLYGSKHLAKQLYNNQSVMNGETINELDKFDILILLDLIGAKNPRFMDYFENTHRWFVRLAEIEYDLHKMNLLKNHQYNYFQLQRPYRAVEDDHIPFLSRNVPILHLITDPFPPEWHTPKDNRDIIDMDTVVNNNLILKVFISEYLHLPPHYANYNREVVSSDENHPCPVSDLVTYAPLLYYVLV